MELTKKNFENVEFLININFTKEIMISGIPMIIKFEDIIENGNISSGKFYIITNDKIYVNFIESIKYKKKILVSLGEFINEEWNYFKIIINKYNLFYKTIKNNNIVISFNGNEYDLLKGIYKYYVHCSNPKDFNNFYIDIYWRNNDNLDEIKDVIHILEIIFLNYDKIIEFIKYEIKRIIKENRKKIQEFLEKIELF
jgi:hypothetical protein